MDKNRFHSYTLGMKGDHYTHYLTFSDSDEKWQIYGTDVGSNEIGPYTTYPPHKEHHPRPFKSVATGRLLNEYQIIYITKGYGEFTSGDKKYNVIPGSILLLFPGVRHSYKPKFEVGWTEYWVGFQGSYFKNLIEEGVISIRKPIYYIGYHHTLLSLFLSIFDEVKRQKPLYQFRIGSKIMMLLAEVLSYAKLEVQHDQSHAIVERAKHIFNSHVYGFIEVDAVANEIGISRSYLCEVFKSYTDMTPYQYFIHTKINKAKELLEIGESSIKEVAFELGFEDQYYFSRLFKKKTGVPPSQWTVALYDSGADT